MRSPIELASAGILFVVSFVISAIKPLPQPADYHQLADQRTIFGVPNAIDVFTNFPYVVVSIVALFCVTRLYRESREVLAAFIFGCFFLSTASVSITSSLYHLAPNNVSLVGDRLSIVFSATFLVGVACLKVFGSRETLRVVAISGIYGVSSMLYWCLTSGSRLENILYYVAFQIFVVCFVAFCCFLRCARSMSYKWLLSAVVAYAASKPFEINDAQFLALTNGLISGHSAKHLVIVFCVCAVLMHMLRSGDFSCRSSGSPNA
ncbi:hypothetical protein KT71_06609 [Congregibacter litoralis KT71]|uniref:Alkaline phytoceramidase (APHC) n=1 Tax=Congregibacter litoralis KT71 TaxID=314285 RepID=A4ABC1_9GAMM|nr:hypothetical protein KT71_06609 [Congregibacter litoralis KT71]